MHGTADIAFSQLLILSGPHIAIAIWWKRKPSDSIRYTQNRLVAHDGEIIPTAGNNNAKHCATESLVPRKSQRGIEGVHHPYCLPLRLFRGSDLFQGRDSTGARCRLRASGHRDNQGRHLRKIYAGGTRPAYWRALQTSSAHCSNPAQI